VSSTHMLFNLIERFYCYVPYVQVKYVFVPRGYKEPRQSNKCPLPSSVVGTDHVGGLRMTKLAAHHVPGIVLLRISRSRNLV
jgi:hypothetical protein